MMSGKAPKKKDPASEVYQKVVGKMKDNVFTCFVYQDPAVPEGKPDRFARGVVFDVEQQAYRIASEESARFWMNVNPKANNLITCPDLLEFGMQQAPKKGLILEFGVGGGSTTRLLGKLAGRKKVHGFDHFHGLPQDWTHFQKAGRWSTDGNIPENLPRNVQIVNGLFKDTLDDFVADHRKQKIAFMHVDCDTYESTKEVFEATKHLITAGTVIVFDEYFNYPQWRHHEAKAFYEFLESGQGDAELIGVASQHQSCAFRITANGPAGLGMKDDIGHLNPAIYNSFKP
jgi:hypothetical protein